MPSAHAGLVILRPIADLMEAAEQARKTKGPPAKGKDEGGESKDLIELFSKRRHDVERRAAQRIASLEARLGRTLTSDERAEQYQRATYNTRPAKTHEDETTLDIAANNDAELILLDLP